MINGNTARLVVLMLFLVLIILIIGIIALTALNDTIPIILSNTLTTIFGVIVGAIGLNFQIPPSGGNKPPSTGS